jgi:hypothetical protein
MCANCWTERGGHKIVNERTIKAAELIQTVYDSEDGEAGGYAHIVVDDWNLDDSDIDFCLNTKGSLPEETATACVECLNFLKALSYEERVSAMAIHSGHIKINQG